MYKLFTIGYKCLHQSAAEYLQQLCVPVMNSASRRHLCSDACSDLQVLTTRTVTYGPCSFAVCAFKSWNSLPTTLQNLTLILTVLQSAKISLVWFSLRKNFVDCLGC